MVNTIDLRCDGCGQAASPEHLAQRLRRLEWTTRYRPVHIHSLLLGAFSPIEEHDFLYSPTGEFRGEAAQILKAAGISADGKPADAVLSEFQRAGLFLAHILECPVENDAKGEGECARLVAERLPTVAARIRRSLKPRRVTLITSMLEPLVQNILALDLGCPVVLDDGKPFEFGASAKNSNFSRFREMLFGSAAG